MKPHADIGDVLTQRLSWRHHLDAKPLIDGLVTHAETENKASAGCIRD
jgi:hypothetical protein